MIKLDKSICSPRIATLIARILLALMFLESVLSHVFNYQNVLIDVVKVGIPFPEILFPASLALETLGIIALITGFQYRLGLLALIMFTLFSTLFFFPFWSTEGVEAVIFRQQFFKNFTVIGLLFLLYELGKGIPFTSSNRNDNA